MISTQARELGLHLGLGDLIDTGQRCMTYACGCDCPRCLDRATRVETLTALNHPQAITVAAADSAAFFMRQAA